MPRIDDTESVEKSLLHTEANFYDFLTAGAGLVRFFADFKQKNLWKMKIRIKKNVNWIFKLADRMRSMQTNGASKNQDS